MVPTEGETGEQRETQETMEYSDHGFTFR
jgi:hypothetical protein